MQYENKINVWRLCIYFDIVYICITFEGNNTTVMARPKLEETKQTRCFRLTKVVIEKGEAIAKETGYNNLSDFMRNLLHNAITDYEKRTQPKNP